MIVKYILVTCPICYGKKTVKDFVNKEHTCSYCHGSGKVEQKVVDDKQS